MNKDINNLTDSILAFFPKFFVNPQEWEYENGKSAKKDINRILRLAKKIKKETEKQDFILLYDFFMFFRNKGERFIGTSVEQLVQEYLKNK